MTLKTPLNEFIVSDDSMSINASILKVNEVESMHYKKLLMHTYMAIKNTSNALNKEKPYLEYADIDNIKTAINSINFEDDNVAHFKGVIIADLTDFQTKIKTNSARNFDNLIQQKQNYVKQIENLESEKKQILKDNFIKGLFVYISKTKEIDTKISALKTRIQKDEEKIKDIKTTNPIANEKDILIYQMYLKEKYSNIAA